MGKHTDIHWREWEEEAFEESRKAKKPILLDLSAVWCHWCHVMDDTSYSDDEIIKLINDSFVAIRVDIDKRPDIRERYNFGGYPTTAFLDAEGDVIAGGTYIPPEQMKRTLMQVKSYYESARGKPEERKMPREAVVDQAKGPLNLEVVEDVLGNVLQQYDELYGGFGGAPKFPQPDVIDLVLYQFKMSGNRQFQRMVEKTLGAMAGGGMYDAVEGGFFRYSVTRDWSEPHYEKMLDVNVGLLRNYLQAHALTGEKWYRDVAVDVLRYLEASLRSPEGGFYGSQDADEEYYKLAEDGRSGAKAPYIDRTLYADLNGQAISTYLLASAVLGDDTYLDAAVASLLAMEERLMGEDGGLYHYWDGGSHVRGLLSDYVYLSKAFLEAYEHVGDGHYLERSEALADRMLRDLRDDDGLLMDRQAAEGDVGLLKVPQKPLVQNAHAALLLLKLRELTGNEEFEDAARRILEGFSGQYTKYSIFASSYALAVVAHLEGPFRLVLVGHLGDEKTKRIHKGLLRPFDPRKVVQVLDPGTPAFDEAQYPKEPIPAVYACVGTQCSPPIVGDDPVKEAEDFLVRAQGKKRA